MVKRVTVLAIVFVVLFCAVYFGDIAPEKRARQEQINQVRSGRMFELQKAFPSRIKLALNDGSEFEFVVDNQKDRWMVRKPGGMYWLANDEQVEKLITTLAEVRKGQVRGRASEQEDLDSFGLKDGDCHRVMVYVMEAEEPEEDEAAAEDGADAKPAEADKQPNYEEVLAADLKVGKRGPTYSTHYIQAADSEEIFLSYNNLESVLNKGRIGQWRDKTICTLPGGLITGFIFQGPEESWTLSMDKGGNWTGSKPEPFPVINDVAQSLVDNITGLKGKGFPEETATLAELGLDTPEYTITLASPLGGFVLFVGKDVDGKTYVRRQSDGYIFEVFRTNIQVLKKTREDITDKAALNAGAIPSGEGVTRREMPKPTG